ncbi:hypothetical protein N8886_00785 [Candidatus Pelagibacter ubique]|nr:hypothetical protein [Candidatus Pelagibacter ubique]MDA9195374.1 hypothetical protein [Candidatus Pelagibacter ubique]MDA9888989.1 hypothetical protein [bacterium]
MTSSKQILANKKNARRSTGPKTKLGKEKVSINAMKLGIYAEHHVMVGEDTEQYKAYVDFMLKTFEVFDAISGLMVQQITSLGWRLQRIPQIECGVFGIEMSEHNRSYTSPNFIKIKHKEFHQTIKKDLDRRSELMAVAYVKDCNGGDRMMKLNTMEGRLLSRQSNLINQYLKYKKSKGKEV